MPLSFLVGTTVNVYKLSTKIISDVIPQVHIRTGASSHCQRMSFTIGLSNAQSGLMALFYYKVDLSKVM